MNTLAAVLSKGRMPHSRAVFLARQLAEELCEAEKHQRSFQDLTPANVMLVGEGQHERARFRMAGAPGTRTVQRDIYSFGRLLETMLPGHRLAAECLSPEASERPDSFELVVEELQEFTAIRTWIGSLLIGAATASLFVYELAHTHSTM